MNTGWNKWCNDSIPGAIINLLGNEYWLELIVSLHKHIADYKPTGK